MFTIARLRTHLQDSVPDAPRPAGDHAALTRYRYLLRTAPPHHIERAHAEAFAHLTPARRREVLARLADEVPARERSALRDDPASLARAATRAELGCAGTMERVCAVASGVVAGIATVVVGSAVMRMLVDAGAGDLELPGDPGS